VQAINAMLDAVAAPIDDAAQTLERMAERDLTARVEGQYEGDFARIRGSLNKAVQNLDSACATRRQAPPRWTLPRVNSDIVLESPASGPQRPRHPPLRRILAATRRSLSSARTLPACHGTGREAARLQPAYRTLAL
jgi:hypothetical protein